MLNLDQFTSILRENGFPVALAEQIEVHELLASCKSYDELRLGMRMILCQNKQQQELFDLLWRLNFVQEFEESEEFADLTGVPEDNIKELIKSKGASCSPSFYSSVIGSISGVRLDVTEMLVKFDSDYKGAIKQLLQGNSESASVILLRILMTESYSLSEFRNKQQEAEAEIEEIINFIGLQIGRQEIVDVLMGELRYRVNEMLRQRVNREQVSMRKDPLTYQNIEDLPLISLRSSQELHNKLKIMGRKFAVRQKRRQIKGHRKINLRRSIRKNIQFGGTILKLEKKKKQIAKPKLVIVTDVSSSTIHASKLFLSIIWHARSVFRDIRYFEFISTCIEVTSSYRRARDINEGVENALKQWNEAVDGKENSNYYQAMKSLEAQLKESYLSPKTTIVLLGDLRDWWGPIEHGIPLSSFVLERLRKQVKQLIVLNPENMKQWGTGDSIVQHVLDKGIKVHETTDLRKLIQVLDQL